MKIYTRRGDDGTTSLRTGQRVRKDDASIELVGAIDEAQAFLGLARAESDGDDALDMLLASIERDLWIVMAQVTTAPDEITKLVAGETAVASSMIEALEVEMDRRLAADPLSPAFAVPGENRLTAALDVARVVVRRAERIVVAGECPHELVLSYLNRLSDLCFVLARGAEHEHRTQHRARRRSAPPTN